MVLHCRSVRLRARQQRFLAPLRGALFCGEGAALRLHRRALGGAAFACSNVAASASTAATMKNTPTLAATVRSLRCGAAALAARNASAASNRVRAAGDCTASSSGSCASASS